MCIFKQITGVGAELSNLSLNGEVNRILKISHPTDKNRAFSFFLNKFLKLKKKIKEATLVSGNERT